jgi:two-component system, OmpR family, response regulator RegX3
MDQRVLVVEDEAAIAEAIEYALRGEGFEVEIAADGAQGLERGRSRDFDLLLLDLMLPRLTGIEVCRRLRAEGATVPIVMLTAKDSELERVLGLELGADDYVTKPFSMPELVARVRALLRRRELDSREGPGSLRVGDLEVDLVKHQALVGGEEVPLTTFELKLLALLASEPERVFSRREIMRHLWQSTHVGDERACDLHVSNIRRKIESDPVRPQRLITVRGAGYKLQPL